MRLLQIIPLHDSYRVFLRELTESLEKDGHEVLTLCHLGDGNSLPPDPGSEKSCQNLTLPRGMNPLAHWRAARTLRKIIADFQPTHIHAHFSAAILTAAMARRNFPFPIVWIGTYQGLQFPFTLGFKAPLIRWAETFSARCMDQAWVLTSDDALALRKAAPKAKVFQQKTPGFGVADRFLDTPLPSEEQKAQLRLDAGLKAEHRVFLFLGRLVYFKGFGLAARAFFIAAEKDHNLRWVVIGKPDPIHPTGLEPSEWERFTKHPAIQWRKTQNDVLPWIDLSDALLFPTSREGMPVSAMEALARATPVLTYNTRGCRELIQDGANGQFLSSQDPNEIAKVLLTFKPFVFPQTQKLRRSQWIGEMKSNYKRYSA